MTESNHIESSSNIERLNKLSEVEALVLSEHLKEQRRSGIPLDSDQKSNKISQLLRKNNNGRISFTNLPFDRLEFDAKIKSNFHAIGSKDVE